MHLQNRTKLEVKSQNSKHCFFSIDADYKQESNFYPDNLLFVLF
ncbi:hypothetical protein LEP1GSC050_2313 [Leptospira broomii serovar Hurstbridge str. 5399]|uniref:Uncharacterized protein n=1 Tax=Leptospira broomii serovar Hurstbridge str. 5399 TaxID=1049789 RepID=T0EZV5_9LEPT|nr:hypothetical protein LEP1GSC050_2313 [Leptospira broomii serovar Hurstbridge str. 5399]